MKAGGIGGGNTRTGLSFENERDLLGAISRARGYSITGSIIFYEGHEVARSYRKHALYRMLTQRGVDYRDHLSKKLLPDDAIYVIVNNTMRAGPGCLNSAPRKLSGFLPGYSECGALRF